MTSVNRSFLLLAASMTFAACNCGDDFMPDAGAPDAGEVDAGATDAGPLDAGVDAGPEDSGVVDAGGADAGIDAGLVDAGVDAGLVDAGTVDAGVDAGRDAGLVDAGLDAGTTDAGRPSFDAGIFDAGIDQPDAGPLYDDAGCPLPTGLTLDAADAGLPVAGLVLWLRPDLAAVTTAGTVCRWSDLSSHGNDLFPVTTTFPVFNDAGLNGHPTITFQNNAFVYRPDVLGLPPTSGRTMAAIMLLHDTTSRSQVIIFGAAGTPSTYFGLDANTWQTIGSREGVYLTNNSFDTDLVTAQVARTYVLSIGTMVVGTPLLPTNLQYSIDGTLRTLTARTGSGVVEDFSQANYLAVGAVANAEVGDVLIYDHELSSQDRAAVEAYLRTRYQ